MANCDMCGKEGELIDAVVEGAMLKVCFSCKDHGNVIPVVKPNFVKSKVIEQAEEEIEVVVDNYSELVKKAREKKGLKQEELAKDVGEKESVIHQIESGGLKPTFKIANKLEAYLNISLIERAKKVDVKKKKNIDFSDKSLTIGDLLKD
tara:strand:- start:615 stop:1061 length:447 start_codon:yes stop_codon:yes gene_type:complete